MLASQRAGEINYYEELGVDSNASSEEIRNAFRALARLLHPDQHTDLQLKKVAEAQMRKLNRIYAVLSDPGLRHEYDESLAAAPVRLFREPRLVLGPDGRRKLSRIAWAAGILCGVGLLIWFTEENAPGPYNRPREPDQSTAPVAASLPEPAAARPNQASLIAGLRADLKAVTTERDAAMRELDRLRGVESARHTANSDADTPTTEIHLPAVAMTELPAPAKLPLPVSAPQQRVERPAGHKLAGFWFYAEPSSGQHNKNQSLYLPEYIEATISEENGVIYGKYRARFRIVDRAISPDVNFTFTGNSITGSQATFPWTGAGGAKGDVTVKFISENSLRFDWNATDLGTQQGLGAGTAILTRRIE